MARMKLKALEECLQDLVDFEKPKVKLEQYSTTAHIAACMIHTIESSFGDIDGKIVADIGCGCGNLTIGALLLGAEHVTGFDIDHDALSVFRQNLDEFEMITADAVLCDVSRYPPQRFENLYDCVIMNPPFGTNFKGIDMDFLRFALSLTKNSVYSLHKTSTREHVLKKAKQFGVGAKVLAELRFDLPATYNFHRKRSVDIEVDFIRFSHK